MENPDALARLGCTAALLGCTPTISARLVHDERPVLEVMRPPHPVRDHAVLPPCWFRALIADATANGLPTDDADRVRFERLLACRLELGVRHGTTVLPANVLRVDAERSWMHLLALASPLEAVRSVAVAQEQADGDVATLLELHVDADLGVTVVGLASERTADGSSAAADVLRTIGMRLAVDRLEQELADRADHPATGAPAHRIWWQ